MIGPPDGFYSLDCEVVVPKLDSPRDNLFVFLLNSSSTDRYIPCFALYKAVVKRISELELSLLFLVEALVGAAILLS